MNYNVRMGEETVGRVSLKKEGLYYFVACTCHFPDSELHRLYLSGDKGTADLGLCTSGREVAKRLPIKSVGEKKLRFFVSEGQQNIMTYPVRESTVNFDIKKLPQAYLRQKMGALYLMVKENQDEG